MSEIQANKLSPASGTALQVGDSGDTITIPSGATITNSGTATGFGMSSANTPMFAIKMSGNLDPSNATWTLIPFDSEEIDTDSAYTNTASNYKFTVPSGEAGKYFIYGHVLINSLTNSDFIAGQLGIYKNGTRRVQSENNVRNTRTKYHTFNVAHVFDLAVGDYIQLYGSIDTDDGSGRINSGENSVFGGFKLT